MDEITKLLSQMGEDGGGGAGGESMKGHAERLWKFLDNLAESDPEEYQNFLKKQAEAAGVGLKARATRGGGAPESVEDHPRLVVLGLEEPSQGQDEREQQHVAILVFENRTDEDDQKGATFQELKLGFKLKSEIRLANHVDGLPRIQGKYKVVEILTPPSVLSHVVPSDPEDPRLATAKAGAPEEGETRSKLDLFVDSVARWSQKRMGRKLQGRRKVLMLKSRAYKNREAAMGTAASDLPETILSKIADMGGPREGGERPGRWRAGSGAARPPASLPRGGSSSRRSPRAGARASRLTGRWPPNQERGPPRSRRRSRRGWRSGTSRSTWTRPGAPWSFRPRIARTTRCRFPLGRDPSPRNTVSPATG